jgi:hypothetical protein
MGITIHYRGRFNKNAHLFEMIEEVVDIAEIYGWEYSIFEKDFSNNSSGKDEHDGEIYGLNIIPPQSEPLYLSFLSNGMMSNYVDLKFRDEDANNKKGQRLSWLSTKTQYAGVDTHKLIIHLLKYLSGKYFEKLEVHDEAEYWETEDEKRCKAHFRRMNELLDKVAIGLESLPKEANESFEDYFERLLNIIT